MTLKSPQNPAPAKMLGKNGFKYKPQFGVIIVCQDEADQQGVFQAAKQSFESKNRKIKVVAV